MNLNGTYEPAAPGATALADARPLHIDGRQVTAQIHEGVLTVFIGLDKVYDGTVPAEIATRGDVQRWVAAYALAQDEELPVNEYGETDLDLTGYNAKRVR